MKIKHFNARQTVKMSKDQFQKIVQNGAEALKKAGNLKYTKSLKADIFNSMGKKAVKNGAMAVALSAFAIGVATVLNSFNKKDKAKTEFIEYQREFIDDLKEKLDEKQEVIDTLHDVIDAKNIASEK